MFFFKGFIVSSLTFRSLIHFEFIFVYGVRKCSNFILLHIAVQFSQHHLLKRTSLLHCIFLPPLSKIRYPQVGFISGFSTGLFWYFCTNTILSLWLLLCSTVWSQVYSSSSIFPFQGCFCYSGSLVFPWKLWKFLFQVCEKSHWEFDKDCIESGRLPWVV